MAQKTPIPVLLAALGAGAAAALISVLIVNAAFSNDSSGDPGGVVAFLAVLGFPTDVGVLVGTVIAEVSLNMPLAERIPLPQMSKFAKLGWFLPQIYVSVMAGIFANGVLLFLLLFTRKKNS